MLKKCDELILKCISRAYDVISCRKVAKNTQILKFVYFTTLTWLPSSEMTQINNKITGHLIAIYSFFLIGVAYIGWYLLNPHVQRIQNMYGKGGVEGF